jgi:hypothetical protein
MVATIQNYLQSPMLNSTSIYSFAVYFGSSIYIGAVPEVVERYGISIEVSSLALALYVFGC